MHSSLTDLKVLIRGGGEMASGIAHRLFRSHLRVAITEVSAPLAVRRAVSFCEAVWDGVCTVEELTGRRVEAPAEFDPVSDRGEIPVLVDPELGCLGSWRPHVLIDATVAKRNLGTHRDMAELVIGFGPGFTAGADVDLVVETNRGHDLGRLIFAGAAEPNTGVPGTTAGYTVERVLRAPAAGVFEAAAEIGDLVEPGQVVARVGGDAVTVQIPGVLRGLLRSGVPVKPGLKAGDVDPRGERRTCFTISEKARALGGSALEAILMRCNS
ncbi:MAG TPA: selenium-dependent molybdenum cofactor biosynthesis protein YqeB [Deferrisomatales bacterium]|nr:selenium-dependent molybdenum cofactor biosynthesis protein YqeB [Deferrisomatales bacterium]